MHRLALATLVLSAACGGGGPVDAAVDALAIDGPPGIACDNGGASTVQVDLGGNAAPVAYPAAWFDHGHGTKACFAIDIVFSTAATVAQPYESDPTVLELQLQQPPVVGSNPVHAHLHAGDTWFDGTVALTAVSASELRGTVTAGNGAIAVAGGFTAPICAGIYDPCL